MAKIPTMDEMAKQLTENALDNFLCNGKSLREWMKIIALEDAISRKAVLEWIKGSLEQYANTYSNDMLNMWMLFEEQIKAMPPVAPTSSKMEQVEDAISKAEVIKLIDKHTNDDGTLDDDITCILEELPPVQPKTKVGKWIRQQSCSSYTHSYECSECGRTIYAEDDDLTDFPYCHCGVKMEVE